MARSRNIKPALFKNEDLADLPIEARFLFIGLWCLADREGRLVDRPRRIGAEIFPYDKHDVDALLQKLADSPGRFIVRYEAEGERYISIPAFVKHQNPHYKEVLSEIPPPDGEEDTYHCKPVTRVQRERILSRDGHKCQECGATENLAIDHIHPRSKGGTSDDDNLQVLCRGCNTRKLNRVSRNVEPTSSQCQSNVEPTSSQSSRADRADSLLLIPDSPSLIPDSPKPSKKRESAAPSPPAIHGLTFDNFMTQWNQIDGICHCRSATSKRKQAFSTRSRQSGWVEDIPAAFEKVACSQFLQGENDRGWKADIDFILKPDSITKIIEGKYDDRTGTKATPSRPGRVEAAPGKYDRFS